MVTKTQLGVAITSALKAGLVLPDGLVVSLLRRRLSRAVADEIILLDGFPSSASLVEAVDQHVSHAVADGFRVAAHEACPVTLYRCRLS